MNIGHYGKVITYIALAAASFLVTALGDDNIDLSELINLGIVVLGAVGVYWAPTNHYVKGVVAFGVAGLTALLSFLSDGVSTAEWLQVGIAALAGIGVVIVPNEPLEAKAAVIEYTGGPLRSDFKD